jgi:hypothetical protein
MEALHKEMGRTVLKLMAHPESTLEQLWGVRLQYAERQEQLSEMRQQLRKHFKDGSYLSERYPWNNS